MSNSQTIEPQNDNSISEDFSAVRVEEGSNKQPVVKDPLTTATNDALGETAFINAQPLRLISQPIPSSPFEKLRLQVENQFIQSLIIAFLSCCALVLPFSPFLLPITIIYGYVLAQIILYSLCSVRNDTNIGQPNPGKSTVSFFISLAPSLLLWIFSIPLGLALTICAIISSIFTVLAARSPRLNLENCKAIFYIIVYSLCILCSAAAPVYLLGVGEASSTADLLTGFISVAMLLFGAPIIAILDIVATIMSIHSKNWYWLLILISFIFLTTSVISFFVIVR